MRQFYSLIAASLMVFNLSAQKVSKTPSDPNHVEYRQATKFYLTPEIRHLTPINPAEEPYSKEVKNDLRRNKAVNADALPQNGDPILQSKFGEVENRAPIQNWNGMMTGAYPHDPSGAAGPDHYFQMVNTKYQIFDKEGNSLYGPSNLSNLWSGSSNDGDPIVMYDKFADRWFLSQFQQSGNKILIAISQTADPLGAYYTYEFSMSSFPDYPKYSVWHDGYYMTANMGSNNAVVFERDKMLVGDPSAAFVAKSFPSVSTPGFWSPLPAHADGGTAPTGPCPFFFFQDDSWSSGNDAIKVWNMDVDWNTPSNTTFTLEQTIDVDPFDSNFQSNWNDIEQPGTSSKLDGVPGAFMYMAQYRRWGSYNTILLNHTVDINGNDHAGVRWYELRDNNDGVWSVYQSGTYAPDTESRWMGSMAMDDQGNIGLAFSISGPNVYPGLAFTGRRASDPLGEMTFTEEYGVEGNGVQSGVNRWGDYAQMTLDPDGKTFWYTGCYIGGSQRTRIFSFKYANDYDNDLGATAITTPTNGALTATENITVTVTNFGLTDQTVFPVSYVVDGGTPVTETYTGTLAAGTSDSYVFTAPADFSAYGAHSIVAYTGLIGDQDNMNDTTSVTVNHIFPEDIGVVAVTAPVSSGSLGATETVTVTIENFGSSDASNFPVSFTLDGGTAVTETYTGTIAAGATADHSFSSTVDLSEFATYNICAYTDLTNDGDQSNDTTCVEVVKEFCTPTADCSYGDGFQTFVLKTINNSSGCDTDGYGDYTNLSTELGRGSTYAVSVTSGYAEQWLTIWIDFNDDLVFSADEMVVTDFQYDNDGNTTLTIPTDAALGEHILRGRIKWQSSSQDPCEDFEYGETEDYTVDIILVDDVADLAKDPIKMFTNQSENSTDVNITGYIKNASINVYNVTGQIVYFEHIGNVNGQSTINIPAERLSSGAYLIKLYNTAEESTLKFIQQ